MKKVKNLFLLFAFFIIPYSLITPKAYAADPPGLDIGKNFGYGNFTSLGQVVSQLVVPLFSLAAFVVTWYFLWGAFDWITSEGDKQRVADARNKITQAIIGFIILIFAFFILQFILYKLFGINLGIIGT